MGTVPKGTPFNGVNLKKKKKKIFQKDTERETRRFFCRN